MKISIVISIMMSFSLIGTSLSQCEDISGDWYDVATEDVMKVSVVGCQLTSKYGTASITDNMLITPTNGILQTLNIKGDYNTRTGTIKWSNGIKWIRSLTSEMRDRITSMEQRLDGVDKLIAQLLNCTKCDTASTQLQQPVQTIEIQQLVDQIQVLNETITEMNKTKCVTNCTSQTAAMNSTGVQQLVDQIQLLNETIIDVNNSKCSNCGNQTMPINSTDAQQLVDQIQQLNDTMSTKCLNCGSQPLGNSTSTDVQKLADQIQELNGTITDVNNSKCSSCGGSSIQEINDSLQILNETITDMNTSVGRDGYCTIEPNATDVYVPVTRYVSRGLGSNKCTIGGPAWRGGAADKDSASMMTRSVIDDLSCRWGSQMTREPMLSYKGDTIVFWRNGGTSQTLYEFDDEKVCI